MNITKSFLEHWSIMLCLDILKQDIICRFWATSTHGFVKQHLHAAYVTRHITPLQIVCKNNKLGKHAYKVLVHEFNEII